MIAASDPLEFVPHGRNSLLRHPGSVVKAGSQKGSTAPESLLHRLKNVAISESGECPSVRKKTKRKNPKEWWSVREICSSRSQPRPNIEVDFDLNDKENRNDKSSLLHENVPNSKVDCRFEEELYVKGRTAIWSRGLLSNPESKYNDSESRVTIKSYTCEADIKHALFCNFHSSINNRPMFDALNAMNGEFKTFIKIEDNFEEKRYDPIPSICIIDNSSLRVFTEGGEDFITSLQFQIRSVWSTKYGILLEKEAVPQYRNSFIRTAFNTPTNNMDLSLKSSNRTNVTSTMRSSFNVFSSDTCSKINYTTVDSDIPLPTCFSLSHPLDEMAPVLVKMSYTTQYYNDGNMEIVFVSEDPSLTLVYNGKSGLHSLYKIRKATSEECHFLCGNINKTSTIFSQSGHLYDNLSSANTTVHKGVSATGQKNVTSSRLGGIGSPFTMKGDNSGSSNVQQKNSNAMAGMFNKLGLAPHTSIGQASNSSMQAAYVNLPQSVQPLYPEVCFEHIWTENQSTQLDNTSAAKKAFLHCDLIGQNYLCFLLCGLSKQLVIARLENVYTSMNDSSKPLIVGLITTLPAKDAANISSLSMIAIIDLSGNIILYSGTSVIGKVHVGGVLTGLINSPYNQIKKFDSPFPRRSSLLPMSSRDKTLEDSSFHQLSPVPHMYGSQIDKAVDNAGFRGLRDPIGNRLTLKYDRGTYYRITLPDMASSFLVLKCLTALKQLLPKEIFMQVISKWYGTRNAPGTQDLCPKLEWSMFVSLIFSLLGYDISKLALTKQPEIGNIEVVSKKQKTSDDGCQEDWEYLLNSGHHVSFGSSLATMLNLKSPHQMSDIKSPNNSNVHKLPGLAKIAQTPTEMDTTSQEYSTSGSQSVQFNFGSLLFPYILQILFSLHLVYEEFKMNVLLIDNLQCLAEFLYQLSIDLTLDTYVNHYWKDFPSVCKLNYNASQRQIGEFDVEKIIQPSYFTTEPPNLFNHLYLLMKKVTHIKYPYINNANIVSKDMIEVIGLISNCVPGTIQTITHKEFISNNNTPFKKEKISNYSLAEKAVLMLCNKGYSSADIQNLPPAIYLFLLNVITLCKANPPVDWPHQAYLLIMREDLALQTKNSDEENTNFNKDEMDKENAFSQNKNFDPENVSVINKSNNDGEKNTGLEHIETKILRLRFPNDHRIVEMCNLLQSSIPVTIALTQRPEVSDHDFIEEQERYLYALCTRTMALPVGRGMVTLRSAPCVVTEPLQIPKLCATGRAPPRNATIELSHIEVPPHYSAWPLFHNGVAAGLKLVPMGTTKIDSAWIVYNKPKQGTADMLFEHAGFLMALGLNGHLKDMAFMDIYEYLVKCHEMTSVGLLLGIAATYRGTMEISTTKLMGIHVEALLPPTSIELDIPQNVQVAALLGVGLLYQKTAHTHITQVLLSEIGRPPGPEMENSSEREGYALAAGLGLGLVCLGSYKTAPHYLTSTLRHYMLGGNKRPLTGAQKEKYKLPSFQIREGPTVNVDVTAPGATLALGMLYLKSGNQEVAKWLAPPPTHYLLDFVRPDLLLLRVIARGLILWDSIEPSEEWVENYVPASVKPYCFVKPTQDHIDYEAMNQVYCNIIAGACFSIGLRFAGSADQDACDTIMYYAKEFTRLGSKSIGELAGKSTIETCLNLVLLSAAMVMAGTGDLQIMRLCRQQRARAGPVSSSLTYGSQLAVHAALGLLFLGAGRYTLSTTPESIAALICAFFPKFPTHSNDNRYHLQAFRHLYVLATEPRLLIPRDIITGNLCYANVKIVMLEKDQVINLKAPCFLPELHKLKEVHIKDGRYWSIVFKRDRNWDQLKHMLKNLSCIDIKQKAGCLSYLEDPQGFQSLLAQMLTMEKTNVWATKPENIFAFSNDRSILNLTKHYLIDSFGDISSSLLEVGIEKKKNSKICSSCYFLTVKSLFKDKTRVINENEEIITNQKDCVCDKNNLNERKFIQHMAMITYECVVTDSLAVLPIWITLLKILRNVDREPNVYHVWQIKLMLVQIENSYKYLNNTKTEKCKSESLISDEFCFSMKQQIGGYLDSWETRLMKFLKNYLIGRHDNIGDASELDMQRLVSYVTFYELPRGIIGENLSVSPLDLLVRLENLNVDAANVFNIMKLLNYHSDTDMI